MNKLLLVATLLTAAAGQALCPNYAAAQAPAMTATACYDPATGTMEFTIGSGIGVVGVETQGKFITGQTLSPPPQQYDVNVVAFFNPSGIPPQTIRYPHVAKTGLSSADFLFSYVPLGPESVVSPVTICSIPEPASIALAVALAIALGAYRRKPTRRPLLHATHPQPAGVHL